MESVDAETAERLRPLGYLAASASVVAEGETLADPKDKILTAGADDLYRRVGVAALFVHQSLSPLTTSSFLSPLAFVRFTF